MAEEGKIVEKSWGREVYITNTPKFCCKELHVEPMQCCSSHRHHVKDEFFRVLEGGGFIEVNGRIYAVDETDYVHIPCNAWHRFWTTEGMTLQEISTHHDEMDVERELNSDRIYTVTHERQ